MNPYLQLVSKEFPLEKTKNPSFSPCCLQRRRDLLAARSSQTMETARQSLKA